MPKTHFPEWNEKLIFPSTFPSLCQSFRVDILHTADCSSARHIVCSAEIHVDDMLFDDEAEQVPTFGPCHLWFYAGNAPAETYVGRVVVSIRTEDGSTAERNTPVVLNIPPLIEVCYPSA